MGLAVYWIIGSATLPTERRQKQRNIPELIDTGPGPVAADSTDPPDDALWAARLNYSNGGLPLIAGNTAQLLDDYDDSLAKMVEAVRGAEAYVHFEFYIVAADQSTEALIAALEDAHRRGCAVRVLIDHLGSLGFPGYKEAVRRLDASGIAWRRMLPVRPWRGEYQRLDLRNHRKILVVDGQVGFTGSQNVIDRSYNKKKNLRKQLQWKDIMVRLEGPVVQQLDALFRADWSSETGDALPHPPAESAAEPEQPVSASGTMSGTSPGTSSGTSSGGVMCQVLHSGPGSDNQSNLRLFNHLFHSAERSMIICTPYFVPDESMFYAITTAVQRGVEVRLHVSTAADHLVTHHAQRSYYEMLLKRGVKIFRYPSPYILHSKFLIIDDDVAVIASSNMDIRSFNLNLEVSLMVCDQDFVSHMMELEQQYRQVSNGLQLEQWLQRPWRQKYIDNVCRLTSSLQ